MPENNFRLVGGLADNPLIGISRQIHDIRITDAIEHDHVFVIVEVEVSVEQKTPAERAEGRGGMEGGGVETHAKVGIVTIVKEVGGSITRIADDVAAACGILLWIAEHVGAAINRNPVAAGRPGPEIGGKKSEQQEGEKERTGDKTGKKT